MSVRFNFHLTPTEEIAPWQSATGTLSLSWFGLTFGWFWIQVGEQELFRYSKPFRDCFGYTPKFPYEDYQVSRYWEDLLDLLPVILDPLPPALVVRIADREAWGNWLGRAKAWRDAQDDYDLWDWYNKAMGWWYAREWDAGHLAYPPNLSFWRMDDHIHVRWDNRIVTFEGIPVWTAQHGEVTVPVADFVGAVQNFNGTFLSDMAKRVAEVHQTWARPEIVLDLPLLNKSQHERETWLSYALNPWAIQQRRPFDWDAVHSALLTLDQMVARWYAKRPRDESKTGTN